jgi:uncharacterized protein (AIM24 family)
MQYVEIELDPQEIVIADPEALWWWTIRSKWKRFSEMVQSKNQASLANFKCW